jgi:hypothetical protein
VIFLPMAAQAVSAAASVSLRAAEVGSTRQAAASGNDLSAA